MPSNLIETASIATQDTLQSTLQQHITQSRQRTLTLFKDVNADIFRLQANPDFSPVGWHLGHIGFTEGLWLLEQEAGHAPLFPEYRRLFAADGLAKTERQNLPPFAEICEYLEHIRAKVEEYLPSAPLETQAWLWYWLVQHESQHCETITWVLQLHHLHQQASVSWTPPPINGPLPSPTQALVPIAALPTSDMIHIEGGQFLCGNDQLDALDNEKQAHWVPVDSFWMDRFPVTQGAYRQFMDAGGYQDSRYWSDEGWHWLQNNPVNHPFHWDLNKRENHPVCGVSWYEADAYARFVGKRLPTEVEWEKAASWHPSPSNTLAHPPLDSPRYYPWGDELLTSDHCNHGGAMWGTTPVDQFSEGKSTYGCYDLLGNVWEWTNTWFHPYAGFQPYPYQGYSMTYFDDQHRVLKGGSWATQMPVLRCAFRNWYEPRIRIHFAGFRCAYG